MRQHLTFLVFRKDALVSVCLWTGGVRGALTSRPGTTGLRQDRVSGAGGVGAVGGAAGLAGSWRLEPGGPRPSCRACVRPPGQSLQGNGAAQTGRRWPGWEQGVLLLTLAVVKSCSPERTTEYSFPARACPCAPVRRKSALALGVPAKGGCREVGLAPGVRPGESPRGSGAESRMPPSCAAPPAAALTGRALCSSVRPPPWAGHCHKSLVGVGDNWYDSGSALYFLTFFPSAHIFCKGPAPCGQ